MEPEKQKWSTRDNTNNKSAVCSSSLNHAEAAVGGFEVMEASVSCLTLFADLSVKFVSFLRIYRHQPDTQGAYFQHGWAASSKVLSSAISHGEGGKSIKHTDMPCLCACECINLFIFACMFQWGVGGLPHQLILLSLFKWELLLSLLSWRLTLVSCTGSREVTVPDNLIYIVCGERSEQGILSYAKSGDLLVLLSPGSIHQMAVFQCSLTEMCSWDSAECQERVCVSATLSCVGLEGAQSCVVFL